MHRLPKPRRRVRFPYAALVGMGLQQEMRSAHLGCRHSSSYLELTKLSVEDEEHEAELRDLTRKARWRTTSRSDTTRRRRITSCKARHHLREAHITSAKPTQPVQSAHNNEQKQYIGLSRSKGRNLLITYNSQFIVYT